MKFAARNTAALVVAFLFSAAAQGADPNLCAACHGEGGNSANPAVPSLAQQPAQFISTSLFMFREGNRKDPQMSPMAEKLSNAEMNELAAYFSKQKAAAPKHKSKPEPFLTGFLQDEKADPPMWGRPVDVLVLKDGSMLVSDDYNGIIYRVTYGK